MFGSLTHSLVVRHERPFLNVVTTREMDRVEGTDWNLWMAVFNNAIGFAEDGGAQRHESDGFVLDVPLERDPCAREVMGTEEAVAFPRMHG